ncbi:hypothetical protein PFNF54_02980 [Plasmodium falciparum NF54]|nr:hypothetical protein PFNF54_02980 [Plasmodium falciparum NF54]
MLSGGIAPTVGLIGSVAVHAWKPLALKATIEKALELNAATIASAAQAAGIEAGKKAVIAGLNSEFGLSTPAVQKIGLVFNAKNYKDAGYIYQVLYKQFEMTCEAPVNGVIHGADAPICTKIIGKTILRKSGTAKDVINESVETVVSQAKGAAGDKVAEVTAAKELVIETAQKEAIEIASYNWYTTIGYSVLAILIIVLIMVIIYLILRYRRKKKMKKKLQYIKLLEE